MTLARIESLADPRVAPYRDLREGRLLEEQGCFVAESRHVVRRLLAGGRFPVRSLFSHHSHGRHVSPFLLADYAGPARFEPADHPRGVGEHPHRGFETVTIVYQGELEHRDSTGNGGRIGAGA